jgi:hypothetical protein
MDNEFAIKTYRYLRIAMIAVIFMLLAAVVVEWQRTGWSCLQGSLSAYYYTPVQSVFVGALITIGVCMIALRGQRDDEDILMNLGGMLAPVVALVPTPDPGGCRSVGEAVAAAPENIQNNMIALFIAGALGLIAAAATLRTQPAQGSQGAQRLGAGAAALIFVGGVLWFFIGRESFDDYAHYGAAVPLFVCIVIVVFLNSRRQWRGRYLTIAILMVVSAVVLVGITVAADWAHGVFFAELALIVLFAIFWIFQTVERWKELPSA